MNYNENSPQDTRIVELEHKVAILTRMVQISSVLNSTLKLKPLLSTIMDAAAEICDAEAASVLLWDSKKNELRFAATTTGSSGQGLIGKRVPLEGSIAGTVLREERIVAVENVMNDPRHYSKVDEDIEFLTASVIGVPMRSKNRVIGVLEAINKRQLPWTKEDRQYLGILAAQAAVAIEAAQLVAALQKANEELNQLDKMKNDFIALASHELRTPLGVILGYASFLQDAHDEEVREHASKVVGSAMHLRSIIEDLTNLRYLEQHPSDLAREDVPLTALVSDVVRDMMPLAEAKSHRLEIANAAPNAVVFVDRIRMGMALTNVLHNAVRFTPAGGHIVVGTQTRGREAWVSVQDNGIGIPKDQMQRIFEKFVQIEDHMTRHNGGLGIGLSIARALVEVHGGRIWAESGGLNRGATFTLAMPLAQEASSTTMKIL